MVKEVIFELSLKKSNPHFPTWELLRGPERPNISKIYYNHHAPSLSFCVLSENERRTRSLWQCLLCSLSLSSNSNRYEDKSLSHSSLFLSSSKLLLKVGNFLSESQNTDMSMKGSSQQCHSHPQLARISIKGLSHTKDQITRG